MTTFYDPGRIPGWPTGRPTGRPADLPAERPADIPGSPAAPRVERQPAAIHPTEHADDRLERGAGVITGGRTGRDLGGAAPAAGSPERRHPAEARVRALRDLVQEAATRLESGAPVLLRELHDGLWSACEAIQGDDLGADGALVGQQFEAFFERLRGLAAAHTGPVPADSLGLPADARFLKDMAEYLTRRFALDAEE